MQHSTIGEFIKNRRTQLGLTQGQVSQKLGWESPQFISNIERSEAHLPPEKVISMAKALQEKPETLVKVHLDQYRKDYEGRVFKAGDHAPRKAAASKKPQSKKASKAPAKKKSSAKKSSGTKAAKRPASKKASKAPAKRKASKAPVKKAAKKSASKKSK